MAFKVIEKKPVCVVGFQKEVEVRHAKTGNLKRNIVYNIDVTSTDLNLLRRQKEPYEILNPAMIKSDIQNKSVSFKLNSSSPYNPPTEGKLYYFLGYGNNCELVDKIMKRRENWTPTSKILIYRSEFYLPFPVGAKPPQISK